MKVLVLGGNGFIGSHLVCELLSSGHSVRVFDRMPEKYNKPHLDVDYRVGQFGDAFSMAEALQGIDVVFHLISTTVPGTSNLNPIADINDNLVATVVLLDQMVKLGVKRIIYLSSGGTVYGNPRQLPVPEDHPLNPICSYGVVKVAVEKYLHMYQELYGLVPTIIRPSNPYGPRQGHSGVQGIIATFMAKILSNQHIEIWGDGSIIRDYMYVGDLVQLSAHVCEGSYAGVLNAGTGEGISIVRLLELLKEVTGKNINVEFKPGRAFDIKEITLDINKAISVTGWRPKMNILDGLRKHWDWYTSLH